VLAAALLVGGGAEQCESPATSTYTGEGPVVDGSFTTSEGGDDGSNGGAGAWSDASGCRPGYVDTFQSSPDAYHPATAAWQGVCSSTDTAAFYAACLGSSATTSDCAQFKSDPSHAVCVACIETPVAASHYGPVVDFGSFVAPNVAGCIELTDPSGLPCAKGIQTASVCERAACEANCPVSGVASLAAYDDCARAADQGVCQSYALVASTCRRAEADSGVSAACVTDDFSSYYSQVVPIFCGVPAPGVDSGTGPVDASTPPEVAGQDGGASDDATVPSEAGDARVPSEAGDARVPSEAGDARVPSEAGDARVSSEAGDATMSSDGGDAMSSSEGGGDANAPTGDAGVRDAGRSPSDAGEEG
jgi:hypothetical protein